jgi:hypothetical protein
MAVTMSARLTTQLFATMIAPMTECISLLQRSTRRSAYPLA